MSYMNVSNSPVDVKRFDEISELEQQKRELLNALKAVTPLLPDHWKRKITEVVNRNDFKAFKNYPF